MTTYITHVRLSPPDSRDHSHITDVRWSQSGKTGTSSRQVMVDHIRGGNPVYVQGSPDAKVAVVEASPPYLRTVADGYYTNNLLNLPRF